MQGVLLVTGGSQGARRLNELVKANGHPELAEVEAKLERSYARLSARSRSVWPRSTPLNSSASWRR